MMTWRTRRTITVIAAVLTIGLSTPSAASSSPGTNVALNKPAAQSSVSPRFHSLTADKAVDGDYTTSMYYCQHTKDTNENDQHPTRWWMVDLQGFYQISSVQITNRGDCCAARLTDFDIQVSMLNPQTISTAVMHTCYHHAGPMGSGVTTLFQCSQPIRGRYVRIIMPSTGVPMHVCEVEVLATSADSISTKYIRTSGHRASGDVLREVTSRSVIECLALCSSDVTCSAVNLNRLTWTPGGGRAECQLLAFRGLGQTDTTSPHPDWDFYTVTDL